MAIVAARKSGQKILRLRDKPWGKFEIGYGSQATSPRFRYPLKSGAAQVNLDDDNIREVKFRSKSGAPIKWERRPICRDPQAPPKFFYVDDEGLHHPYSQVSFPMYHALSLPCEQC